jgi:preprotein translocase subunit SecE
VQKVLFFKREAGRSLPADKQGISLPVQSFLFVQINNMNKISTYFRESYKELMEKVSWPTWAQLQQSTMIVLAATLVITAMVWAMDFATGNILKQVYKFLF